MTKDTLFVGLDVHAKSIAVAVAADAEGERYVGKIPKPDRVHPEAREEAWARKSRYEWTSGNCRGAPVNGIPIDDRRALRVAQLATTG